MVKLCLDAGADVKSRTNAGKTPLILASSEGHADVVKLLVERGADIGAKDLEGATAWTEAARRGHLPIVKFLVQMGANVAAISGAFLDSQLVLATLHNDLARAKELLMQLVLATWAIGILPGIIRHPAETASSIRLWSIS